MTRVILLSTADWAQSTWTNKQYVATGFARSHPVTYIESLGLRRPEFTVADARRVLGRLGAGGGAPALAARPVPDGVEIVSPIVIPYHRGASARLNRSLLDRVWRRVTAGGDRCLLWTFSPVTYGLEDHVDAVVYHAVDVLASQPGLDAEVIDRAERALAERVDVTIASSRGVALYLETLRYHDIQLLENVADTGAFAGQGPPAVERRGHVCFVGNLTPQKVDWDLVEQVVAELADVEFSFAGPVDQGGGPRPPAWVFSHDRLHTVGVLSPQEAGALCRRSSVGLIPYRSTPYSAGVFPMKTFEYLAAGAGVVASGVPSLATTQDDPTLQPHVRLTTGAEAFATAVRELDDRTDEAAIAQRSASAAAHSWEARWDELEQVMAGLS